MKIIAVTNQKGGVGKTTTAVTLSAAIAGKGFRVLLVDLDPQGNASSVVRLPDRENPGLYPALLEEISVAEAVQPTRIANLHLLAADLDLAGAEVEVARMEGHLYQLRKVLEPLKHSSEIDFVFLDCPPSLGILMSNALVAADEMLIPIQCEYYALEGLSLLMRVAAGIRTCGANPQLAISGLVMTMFDSRTRLNASVIGDVRDHFQEVVYETPIPRTVRFGEAPSHGLTILEYEPQGAGALAYLALAEEFVMRQERGIAFEIPEPPQPQTESALS